MRYLRVHRKGYTAQRDRTTYRVQPSTYNAIDRGATGRGPNVVPPLKSGSLGGQGFFSRPLSAQKKVLRTRVRQLGERKVVAKLRAIQVLTKRTKPSLSRKAAHLAKWVAGSSRGKQSVNYPKGLRKYYRKRRR